MSESNDISNLSYNNPPAQKTFHGEIIKLTTIVGRLASKPIYLEGEGNRAMPLPPFLVKKYDKSQQKRIFNGIFVISGGHCPGCGQSKIIFIKINQNCEYFQTILEQFVYEFNQNVHQNVLFFLKKKDKKASPPDPRLYTKSFQKQYFIKNFRT